VPHNQKVVLYSHWRWTHEMES